MLTESHPYEDLTISQKEWTPSIDSADFFKKNEPLGFSDGEPSADAIEPASQFQITAENFHSEEVINLAIDFLMRERGGNREEIKVNLEWSGIGDATLSEDGTALLDKEGKAQMDAVKEAYSETDPDKITQHQNIIDFFRENPNEFIQTGEWDREIDGVKITQVTLGLRGYDNKIHYLNFDIIPAEEKKPEEIEKELIPFPDLDKLGLGSEEEVLFEDFEEEQAEFEEDEMAQAIEEVAEIVELKEEIQEAQEMEEGVGVLINSQLEEKLRELFVDEQKLADVHLKLETPVSQPRSIADFLASSFVYAPGVVPDNTESQSARVFGETIQTVTIPRVTTEREPLTINTPIKQAEIEFSRAIQSTSDTKPNTSPISFMREVLTPDFSLEKEVSEMDIGKDNEITGNVQNLVKEKTEKQESKDARVIEVNEIVKSDSGKDTPDTFKEDVQESSKPAILEQQVAPEQVILEEEISAVVDTPDVKNPTDTFEVTVLNEDSDTGPEDFRIESVDTAPVGTTDIDDSVSKIETPKNSDITENIEPVVEKIEVRTPEAPSGIRLIQAETMPKVFSSEKSAKVEIKNEVPNSEIVEKTSVRSREVLEALDISLEQRARSVFAQVFSSESLGRRQNGISYIFDDAKAKSEANDNQFRVVSARDGITMRIAA